jgi:hypothetical protein
VLVPTRRRLDRLRVLRESFAGTTDGKAELVFRVDDDDVETQDELCGSAWLELTRVAHVVVVIGPRLQGYRSLPAFFNELATAAGGDVLMCGNDDMVFRTPGWPSLILEAANRYPDGLFDLGVATHNADHYPFAIVSRRTTDRLGFLWDPRIFWGDIFLRDVMAAFGRCEMLPHVQIDHDWAGWKPDQVFKESDKSIPRGYWSGVHAQAVREAVARLT